MRPTLLLVAALMLALVGCGSKDPAPDAANPASTPNAKMAEGTPAPSTAPDAAGLKEKVVGEWTCESEQGASKLTSDISIRADGSFVNAGNIEAESPGADGTVKMKISYEIDGKWAIDGDSVTTTPDNVKAKVEDMQITAKDPANQAAVDSHKEELTKKAEDQMKTSLNAPSKSKVENATADELDLVADNGAKLKYVRKK